MDLTLNHPKSVDEVKALTLESVNTVEELQEDGAVKGQSRDPCTQKLNREDYGVDKYILLL
jgi:hypothetical protein